MHSERKFSAVLGTSLAYNSITIQPTRAPPTVMSKKTRGFTIEIRS
jgi:hypothetical protein